MKPMMVLRSYIDIQSAKKYGQILVKVYKASSVQGLRCTLWFHLPCAGIEEIDRAVENVNQNWGLQECSQKC